MDVGGREREAETARKHWHLNCQPEMGCRRVGGESEVSKRHGERVPFKAHVTDVESTKGQGFRKGQEKALSLFPTSKGDVLFK